jgi:hypothetical protein
VWRDGALSIARWSAGSFVSPHAADDALGEVTFVGAAGISPGLDCGELAVDQDVGHLVS